MANNTTIITEIRDYVASAPIPAEDNVLFKLGDIHVDPNNGFILNNKTLLAENASKYMLKEMGVTNKFIEIKNQMQESDWTSIANKLKDVNQSSQVYGKLINDSITDLFKKRKSSINPLDYEHSIQLINNILSTAPFNFRIGNIGIDPKNKIVLDLYNTDITIDPFNTINNKTSAVDPWNIGCRFKFDSISFVVEPIYQRLVCSNGAVAIDSIWSSKIDQPKFNEPKIKKMIERGLVFSDKDLVSKLELGVNKMKGTNLSINEFYELRRLVGHNYNPTDKSTDVYKSIVDQYFNDSVIYSSYGLDIKEKSIKWKKSANSGMNAYDMFNQLTYISSHADQFGISADSIRSIEIGASKMLKMSYDLNDLAPKINVQFPKTSLMN